MTHHGTPLKRMGMDLRDTPIAGAADGLRRAAAPLRALGLQRLLEPLLDRDLGARLPDALRVARGRLPAQRRARRTPAATTSRRIRAELGIEPGQTAVLYAPTHREYRTSYVPVLDLAARGRGARPRLRRAGPRALLLRCGPARCAELHRQGRVRDVAGAPVGRGAVPRGGRPAHRLLLDHVRLRRPRPPDRHPRPRLGGLPRAARHLLRPPGGAARASSRGPRTR